MYPLGNKINNIILTCECVNVTLSCLTVLDPTDCSPPRVLGPWRSPGKNSEVDCHTLLQGTFLTQ